MSDLISRKELIETLMKCRKLGRKTFEVVVNVINAQPTAYDIDKVVDELEKASKDVSRGYLGKDNNKYHKHYKAVKLSKAIEIVKQGSLSDDACEWKLEDKEANLYLTGCQQRQLIFDGTSKENGYRYCPYC